MSAAVDLMASLVLEDGRPWGSAATEWQWQDARAVLDAEREPFNFLTRGRGGAKTSDLAGLSVSAMLTQAPAGARLYAGAADRDQAALFVDSIRGYAERTPALRGALRIDSYKVTALRSGATLDVLASDAPSSWGLRPWLLLLDEIAQWPSTPGPRTFFESLSSAVAKIVDARMVLLTSAGDPGHWSKGVLDHAIRDPLWRVNEVPGPVPWLAPERLEEQRRRLPESTFARLFLNRWTAGEDRLVDPDDLLACVAHVGPLPPESGRRYCVSLDVGVTSDRTAVAVAHLKDREAPPVDDPVRFPSLVVLDRMETWKGSKRKPVQLAEVAAWVKEVSQLYNRAPLIFDPSQAIMMSQELRKAGMDVTPFVFSVPQNHKLATTLHQAIRGRSLALPDDPELLDELRNVRLVERGPNTYRIDHDSNAHDDRVIALGMCVLHLIEKRPQPVWQSCGACGLLGGHEDGEWCPVRNPEEYAKQTGRDPRRYVDEPSGPAHYFTIRGYR